MKVINVEKPQLEKIIIEAVKAYSGEYSPTKVIKSNRLTYLACWINVWGHELWLYVDSMPSFYIPRVTSYYIIVDEKDPTYDLSGLKMYIPYYDYNKVFTHVTNQLVWYENHIREFF